MKRSVLNNPLWLIASFVILAMVSSSLLQGQTMTLVMRVQDRLRDRIESAGIPIELCVRDDQILAKSVLPAFYERRAYRPAWSDNNGPLTQVDSLLKALEMADSEGLTRTDYHLRSIISVLDDIRSSSLSGQSPSPARIADLDLLLTDAFLVFGRHLLSGRVDPVTFDPEWMAKSAEADIGAVLDSAMSENRIGKRLADLLPAEPEYPRLRQALAFYHKLQDEGGWPAIPDGPALRRSDSGPRVALLRKRLFLTHDLAPGIGDKSIFDDSLEAAVRHFQVRNGLDADGIVGPKTLHEMNITVEERVHQLALNLERWRWMPRDLGRRYITVNIAGFELAIHEDSTVPLRMRVIVGKSYRRTPVFSDVMTYIVINPYWNVPASITVKELLPKIRKDPGYLAEQDIQVIKGWGSSEQIIDPTTIDWHAVTGRTFNYRLRQVPGPLNPLGHIKFMLPNPFDVYLHDTPERGLFAKDTRTFSHGCIRIEKPIDLAEYLLRRSPRWTRDSIIAAIDQGTERTIGLPQPISVHVQYWTAWVNADGTVNFRSDIYGRDELLERALSEEPPGVKLGKL